MAEVERCQEAIANYVLDAGEPVSYRLLASQVGGESATRVQAMAQFWSENKAGVGAVYVVVERDAVATAKSKSADPRARVIRITAVAPVAETESAMTQVYGVYPSAHDGKDEDAQEAMKLALWAQERKVRNDLFAAMTRHKPLTRELRAFLASDVHCAEATSRADTGNSRGEEAVSMFDSIKATSNGSSVRSQATTSSSSAAGKPSFFKGSNSTTSSAASSSKSGSFFKSSSSASSSSTMSKAKPAAKNQVSEKSGAKRIDADAMNNVLTVDSDDDSDEDEDAPTFVKSTPATKPRAKRVMITDDEDEDDVVEEVAPPPKNVAARASAKRKLSDSLEPPAKQAKPASPKKAESPKRQREEEAEEEGRDDEPMAEDDTIPTGPIKRRELVTKTRITDDGYMVTEKTYEEVEISTEQLAKERAEAKKKQAAAKAAADAQKARAAAAAAAASKSAGKGGAGPAKQKKLDFFFTRK